jgi:Na+-translocating ferredoxin:NAD+ oxidoreductase RnfD subunit
MHVAAVLLTLQVLGQTVLGFRLSIAQILACLATGALIEFGVAFFKDHQLMWPASGLLTGNSTAFILRVPGTLHGQWWSDHGIWIFIGVVAVSMASKYLIRWRGRHIFNPSNLGLVLAFVTFGPQYTEPQDLWWISMGPWLILTYAVLIGGGVLIAWRLKLLEMEVAFMAAFAAFVAIGLAPEPDHCMVASWHLTPICGVPLWTILVTSPELLIFALFMMPDPRTVPDGRLARIVFGILVALFAVLLLGPTTLEFWTKTAILGSLVLACGLRFALVRFLEPLAGRRFYWRVPAGLAVALLCVGCLPVAADLSTHGPLPAAAVSDGSVPVLPLVVGAGPGIGGWVDLAAGDALPPPDDSLPVAASATARVWVLPPLPAVAVSANVASFDASLTPQVAATWGRQAVLDLVIEAEARRSHDPNLAKSAALADGLKPFTDYINQDQAAGKSVTTTYAFESASLTLFLPKFSTQAPRLVGITLNGTATLVTKDGSGHVLSRGTGPYSRSWALGATAGDGRLYIVNDYTGLNLAG